MRVIVDQIGGFPETAHELGISLVTDGLFRGPSVRTPQFLRAP